MLEDFPGPFVNFALSGTRIIRVAFGNIRKNVSERPVAEFIRTSCKGFTPIAGIKIRKNNVS